MSTQHRFYRGLTAGLLAGIPMTIWSHASFYLGLGKLRYIDWAGMLIFGSLPETLFQKVYAQIIHLLPGFPDFCNEDPEYLTINAFYTAFSSISG